MASIVAGSTYLLAPPPPKSYAHAHLLPNLLCHPSAQSRLLLQLQRKDIDDRHAFPQFDLVTKKAGRRRRSSSAGSQSPSPSHEVPHPREVAVQHSETGEKVATVRYTDGLNASARRKAGIAADDSTAIAVVDWDFHRSSVKTWTVHRYESKRKGYKLGYEFRMRSYRAPGGSDGSDGLVILRWAKKLRSESPAMQDRPASLNVSTKAGRRRSSSVSSDVSETPRRRHTFPAPSPRMATNIDPKWEFSCNLSRRRVMASMTPQHLRIHSISSTSSNVSSPSTSSFEDDLPTDRDMTPGKMFQFIVVTALLVGLEEDFASKLQRDFLSLGGLRTPAPDDAPLPTSSQYQRPRVEDIPEQHSPEQTLSPVPSTPKPLSSSATPVMSVHNTQSEPKELLLSLRTSNIDPGSSYATRSWNYLSSTASACVNKIISLTA
jgi:hypothetical protein